MGERSSVETVSVESSPERTTGQRLAVLDDNAGLKRFKQPSRIIFVLAILSNVILAAILPRLGDRDTEVTRIAASIASGRGFSSPFQLPTGPSAWIAPVYPYLLAGIYRVFGVFTTTSYWVAVGLNILVHAFTCILLYWITAEAFGRRRGFYAAVAVATFPLLFQPLVFLHVLGGYGSQGLFIPPVMIWYTHFSEISIVLLFWLTLRKTHWAVYGAAWGITTLVSPTILSLVPAFFAWRLWKHRERWLDLGLVTATAALCISPWLVRNDLVFHHPVFIRDDFGVELRVGNQPGSNGQWTADVHPDRSAYEASRIAQIGEPEYCHLAGQEAMRIIRARPAEYAHNVILRIGYWWIGNPMSSRRLHALGFLKYLPQVMFSLLAFYGAGRALSSGNHKTLLFIAVLVFYPVVYYLTHTFQNFQYMYPIQPEMLALAAAAIPQRTKSRIEGSHQ